MHEALCRSSGTTLDIPHVERRAADHSANIGSNYLCRRNRLMGLIDWSNALIAAPMLELARIAEYGGLSPAFATGYQLTPDMTAALDRETGIACRLYTVAMLCVLFLAQLQHREQAERQIIRLEELLRRLGGINAI